MPLPTPRLHFLLNQENLFKKHCLPEKEKNPCEWRQNLLPKFMPFSRSSGVYLVLEVFEAGQVCLESV